MSIHGCSVLIIESELILGLVLSRILERRGCTNVTVVSNGLEGKQTAYKMNPDLIIIDQYLTDMNAMELIREFNNSIHTKFLIIKTKPIPKQELTEIGLDASSIISKPFDHEEVYHFLDNTFDK